MAAYFAIGCITVIFAYITNRMKGSGRVLLLLISGIPSAWLAAVRYNIGPDYMLYVRIFDSIGATGSFYSVKSLEPGYTFLNRLVLFFNGNQQALFFVVAWLIATMFFLGALRLSENYTLSVALFFAMGFYCDSLNGLRQYIAASITFFALSYLADGRRLKAVILCLIAMLFHQSALVMVIVCLFADKVRITSWKAICITAVLIVSGNYLYSLITNLLSFTRYAYYLGSIEYVVNPTLGATLLTSILTVAAIATGAYRPSAKDDIRHRVLTNMNMLALVSAILSFFIPLALRMQYYFVPIEIVFLPYLLSFVKNRDARFLLGAVLFVLFLCMNVIGMVFNGWYGAYPYQMVR
ncbi:MAG: EpsG family protein [Atopobium sp.]|jgi:transmembrane protein EpsG